MTSAPDPTPTRLPGARPGSGTGDAAAENRLSRAGLGFALAAYGLWGFMPVYFLSLAPASAFEIVAVRILFSLVFCAVLLTVTRQWRRFLELLRDRRLVATMALAGVLIYVNWQVFVLGALTGHVIETSLGYFINPIVTVVLAVVVQHERLRPAQWVAVGLSALAVVVLAVGYGSVPWISLALAFSFGFYGLIKKRVGPRIDAVSGLTLETLWLAPVAIVQLVIVSGVIGLSLGTVSPVHTVLMVSAGVITAVPLLFFAGASRRLPLAVMGFVQYLAPIMQFVVGVVLLQEDMPLGRWIGFAIVWVALIVLSADLVVSARSTRSRRAASVLS